MPLSKQKINDIWWSGFCERAVRFAAPTDFEKDRPLRQQWMKLHVKECKDCRYAVKLKSYEQRVAKELGPGAEKLFDNGEDVTKLPGAAIAIQKILSIALISGQIDRDFLEWMSRCSVRNGKDFSIHVQS